MDKVHIIVRNNGEILKSQKILWNLDKNGFFQDELSTNEYKFVGVQVVFVCGTVYQQWQMVVFLVASVGFQAIFKNLWTMWYFCRFGCYGHEIGVKSFVLRGLAPRSILDLVYLFDYKELLLHFHMSWRVFGELLKVVQVVLD
eukprot:TRINITY_DN9451_c0_g2_i2.p2 TRINITY_DN9451_c0_g2~~TRINITY_DN9451_c0_g2_i2.p2  ORF type:complete len:143 (-),score=10.88 TRINITY_DN9451_c0_g2_i2:103-531(-)